MKRFFCVVLACVGLSPLFAGGGREKQTQEPSVGSDVSNVPPEETVTTVSEEIRMPLTLSILQRLKSEDITKIQLINSGKMSLEREEYPEPNATIEEEGVIKFENIHTSKVVMLEDQTDGRALKREDADGEVVLSVCFEESGENKNKLRFSVKEDDPDGYFYLKKDNSEGIPLSGEEKGVVEYAGERYKVKYSGEKGPFLLIRFIQEHIPKSDEYTMKGWKVE
jgi:hypothetical protein